MPDTDAVLGSDLMRCKCGLCSHDNRMDCVDGRCYCCDLEDAFSILTHHEFDSPQSKVVTSQRHQDSLAVWPADSWMVFFMQLWTRRVLLLEFQCQCVIVQKIRLQNHSIDIGHWCNLRLIHGRKSCICMRSLEVQDLCHREFCACAPDSFWFCCYFTKLVACPIAGLRYIE